MRRVMVVFLLAASVATFSLPATALPAAPVDNGMVFGGHVSGPADGGCMLFVDPAKGRVVVRKLRGELDDISWKSLLDDVLTS